MRKLLTIFLFAILNLAISGNSSTMANDSYYLMKKGDEERALGKLSDASSYYQEYILTHPITLEAGRRNGVLNNRQYFLRNLLLAYNHLLDILREYNQTEQLDLWLDNLTSTYDPDKFRSKNKYTLARILLENNRTAQAIPHLEEIIDDQINDYWADNNKVFLRTAGKLIPIYTNQGDTTRLEDLYQKLEKCRTTDFDENDITNLATLYIKNKATQTKAEKLLASLLNKMPDRASKKPSIFKATAKLMGLQHQNNNREGLRDTIKKSRRLLDDRTTPRALYQLAITYFKVNERHESEEILKDISSRFSDTVWARKSLFLLGRNALSKENWNEAIDYYSTYIERYPQQKFFCLKAYSNLLDAYWARDGNLKKQQVDINLFADILNESTDYETHLNMARDLHHKGFDRLAESTFTIGHTYAIEKILKNPNSLEAMRVNWQLTKYAYELGRIDLARESGEYVTGLYDTLKEQFHDKKSQRRADHYLSRTYLWLAKIYTENGRKNSAMNVLHRFVNEYPGDKDRGYATFRMATLYEKDLERKKAVNLYKSIKKGKWQEKAEKALKRMGAQ